MSIFLKICKIFRRCCLEPIMYLFAFHPPRPPWLTYHCQIESVTSETIYNSDDHPLKEAMTYFIPESNLNWQLCFIYPDKSKHETKRLNYFLVNYFNAKYTLLYSHGNSCDLGNLFDFCLKLSEELKCNVVAYDYSGYGASSGKPSEKNLYKDIDAVFNDLCSVHELDPANIILYGASIGTAPTIDLASRCHVGGVILVSPFMFVLRIPFPNAKNSSLDVFLNIDKVRKITSKVLVIHGQTDTIVPFYHGFRIQEECPSAVEPLWTSDGHNICILKDPYLSAIQNFIYCEFY